MLTRAETRVKLFVMNSNDPFHILLTNDDGHEAPGIRALQSVLKARGYRVSMVAPSDAKDTPWMKSRRVISRSIPSWRSAFFIRSTPEGQAGSALPTCLQAPASCESYRVKGSAVKNRVDPMLAWSEVHALSSCGRKRWAHVFGMICFDRYLDICLNI